jgi:hypothetical protein
MALGSIRQEGSVEDDEDLSECTRCEGVFDSETLHRMLDWNLCEVCVDDI